MKRRIRSLFFSLWYMFRLTYATEKKLFLFNLLFIVLAAIFPVLSLWTLRLLVDEIVATKTWMSRPVLLLLGGLVAIQVLQALLQQWGGYVQQLQQHRLQRDVSMRIMRKAGGIRYDYFENPAYVDSLHMVQQQSAYLPGQIMQAWQSLIQQVFLYAGLGIFLATLHWSIPFVLLLLGGPMAFSRLYFGRRQFELEKNIAPLQRKSQELYVYTTAAQYAKESRIFAFSDYFSTLYRQLQDDIIEQKNRVHRIFLSRNLWLTLIEVLLATGFTIAVLSNSLSGAISLGAMLVYFQAFQRLQGTVASVFRNMVSLHQHQLYLQELIRFLDLPEKDEAPQLAANSVTGSQDGIHIRHLSFRYPGTADWVLSDLNMDFPSQGIVAIVGENGSGKSTLVKLLCGLYDVEKGDIQMLGRSLSEAKQSTVQERISVLFQDFGKYYLTIRDNVALGDENVSRVDLENAIRDAHLESLVNSMPAGSDALLGRTYRYGQELSGGQWQKIALARALYKPSDMLILDEPTSSMDPLAEYQFMEEIRRISRDKLVMLITHRLYNLQIAEKIFVLEKGKLIEQGGFTELLQRQGLFHQFYKTQRL